VAFGCRCTLRGTPITCSADKLVLGRIISSNVLVGVSTLRELRFLCCVNDVLFRHAIIVRTDKWPDGCVVIVRKRKS
jgi:hypothetical protein